MAVIQKDRMKKLQIYLGISKDGINGGHGSADLHGTSSMGCIIVSVAFFSVFIRTVLDSLQGVLVKTK